MEVKVDNVLNNMVEVTLNQPENFLKVVETLTRIGVENKNTKTLYQTCHLLHKRGKYYIVHFKEMFLLDGRVDVTNIAEEDIKRRNRIVKLLTDWNFIKPVNENILEDVQAKSKIAVIPYKNKADWNLQSQYTVGSKNV